jgi:acyl-coenzyme A synthetase/AMP-(fatty) acid ligase
MSETLAMFGWGTEDPDPARPIAPPQTLFTGLEVKIVDAEGQPIRDGEKGELLVRGGSVTIGLHKVDRAKIFDADGYYRTGDEVQLEGPAVYFLGRLGDMIKTSGANVAPAEVERDLVSLEGVLVAHVVGVDDSERGQVVAAAVILEDGVELDADDIRASMRAITSNYKVPRLIVFMRRDDIPLTPSGKVIKRELARMIREQSAAVEPVPAG